jgi:riboflavin synthase
VTVRDPADAIGWLNRRNSGTDGDSPDGRQHARGRLTRGVTRRTPAAGMRGQMAAFRASSASPEPDREAGGAVFTGIVTELGKTTGLDRLADSARLTIHAPAVAATAVPGSSVAVNGVCLTVTETEGSQFRADVIGETLARSTLGELAPGAPVNLEQAALVGGRLDGHIVQGHVDGTGVITERRSADRWHVLRISIPAGLSRYVAEKGSVAVDGVSLTVSGINGPVADALGGTNSEISRPWFEVSLIPETLSRTTLGTVAVGDRVNIEVDVIAKYVERLLAGDDAR